MSETPPWSFSLAWSAVGADEKRVRLVADPAVRAALTAFLDVVDVKALSAELTVRAWLDGLEIDGRVAGVARRTCGVSLEDFDEAVDAPLHVRAVPSGSRNAPEAGDGEVVVDLDADDPPDVVDGDRVDLAAYATEIFALALDPFPRKPGAVFTPPAESEPPSPFAVLRQLTSK